VWKGPAKECAKLINPEKTLDLAKSQQFPVADTTPKEGIIDNRAFNKYFFGN
jgi:hypothetical protein